MNTRASRRNALVLHARSLGLDGALVFSWRRSAVAWLTGYAPGFVTNQATLWLPTSGQPELGVRFPFETNRATAVSGLAARPCDDPVDLIPTNAERVGLISGDLAIDETPTSLLAALERRRVAFVDLHEWMDNAQEVKCPEEIEGLRRAGEIGAAALIACGESAPLGWSDWQIATAVESACRTAGARRAGCLVGIGDGAFVTECSGSVVGEGQGVGLELTLYAGEWCMHVNGQLMPQQPKESDLAADEACRRARTAMKAAMNVGVAVDRVVAVGDEVLAGYGFLGFKEYDFGHGLAADTPTHPRLIAGTGRVLADQSVIALHVAVRVPGGPTGFVGGPVLVTTAGAEELVEQAPWSS